TRMGQAIETIQSLFFALRTNRFKQMNPQPSVATWRLTEADTDFDKEWTWMGSHGAWRAAMLVFLYPENLLLPSLRENSTQPFIDFVEELRANPSLTPQQGRDAAKTYLTKLRAQTLNPPLPSQLQPPFIITEQLDEPALVQWGNTGKTLISQYPNAAYLREVFYFVPMQLALQLQQARQFAAALDWFRLVYAYNRPLSQGSNGQWNDDQRKIYYGLLIEHGISSVYQRTPQWLLDSLNPHAIVATRADAYTRFTLLSLVRCLLDFADAEFTHDTSESNARARSLYISALELLALPEFGQPSSTVSSTSSSLAGTAYISALDLPKTYVSSMATAGSAGFAPNPILAALRWHADVNLFKLHNGRNIAGMQREEESNVTAASPAPQPTPYRYATLIERAKHLVS